MEVSALRKILLVVKFDEKFKFLIENSKKVILKPKHFRLIYNAVQRRHYLYNRSMILTFISIYFYFSTVLVGFNEQKNLFKGKCFKKTFFFRSSFWTSHSESTALRPYSASKFCSLTSTFPCFYTYYTRLFYIIIELCRLLFMRFENNFKKFV